MYSRESPCSKRKGKKKTKKHEWERDKAAALLEKGRESDTIHKEVEKLKYIKSLHSKAVRQERGQNISRSRHLAELFISKSTIKAGELQKVLHTGVISH